MNENIEINNFTYELNDAVYDYNLDYIPVLNSDVEYNTFFKNHLYKNVPCIIQDISSTWPCNQTWILENKINYDNFIKEYGDLEAPVADCNTLKDNAHCKINMKVKDYINYIKNPQSKILYLKDWHLKQKVPNKKFYEVPHIFALDWLNEYAVDNQEDDFMFVYIGPSGSWTPVHVDVYSSYSWSVNVTGLKKWILFPPGEEEKLKDSFGNLPLQFNIDTCKDVKYYEIIQGPGDGLFVPSGWHHQVSNLEDSISINHNWINGCNVHFVWKALEDTLKRVEHEIEDLKSTPEFSNYCQTILKSLFGMDYLCFVKILLYTAEKRLCEMEGEHKLKFDKFIIGNNCIKFDLKSILNIFNIIITKKSHYEKYLAPKIIDKIYDIHNAITNAIENS